jgi:asparagine synthase (glutamine-hydrolysing)
MTRLLAHRGPDDEGYYRDDLVGLGMRRLSIIDLETGQQPVSNEAKTVWVIFNGEIYNYRELRADLERAGHRFATHSDTEVLAHGYEQWGQDLPDHLRGMFAFAVWDSAQRVLFLARDHFGIKPLYYTRAGALFMFASEIKSLLSYPGFSRSLDVAALDQYLSFLYIPEPRTIFTEIQALPPGHTLTCTDDEVSLRRYWQLHPAPDRYSSRQEAVEDIRSAFEDSVRAHLVADVPLGVFLSGGVDSTSMLAMMAHHTGDPVRTFSIGFGLREKHWDELEAAGRVAGHFGTEHHEFRLEPSVVDLLPRVVAHFDQPFANPTAVILYLLSAQTSRHVKVALAGTGGDEMLAGYPRYLGMMLYNAYGALPVSVRRGAARLARWLMRDAADGWLLPQRARRFLEGGAAPFAERYLHLLVALDTERKRSLYSLAFSEALGQPGTFDFIQPILTGNALVPEAERLMLADVQTYLPFNQLAYGDRMSMAHSLEVRVPFVDRQMAEVCASIPLRWKLAGGRTKSLFREAMRPCVPDYILGAPKLGLNLPIALWFRTEMSGWVESLLSADRLAARGYFQPQAVAALLAEHRAGRRDHSLFIWALVVLEVWHQLYLP